MNAALVLLIPLGLAVAYWLACCLTPFTACRHCNGEGKRPSLITRTLRRCSWCDGSGHRLRLGRRWWTAVRR